jgi:hypothetical protein
VIAEEVRKLAEESRAFAEQIQQICQQINSESVEVIQAMKGTTVAAIEGKLVVESAASALLEISSAVLATLERVREITRAHRPSGQRGAEARVEATIEDGEDRRGQRIGNRGSLYRNPGADRRDEPHVASASTRPHLGPPEGSRDIFKMD